MFSLKMSSRFGIVCALFCLLTASHAQQPTGFRNFIRWSMLNFPAWMESKGYDPSPPGNPINLNESLPLADFSAEIRNHVVQGHSNIIRVFVLEASLTASYFMIDFSAALKTTGEYSVTGNVLSTPFDSTGDFVGGSEDSSYRLELIVRNLQNSSDGEFIDISQSEWDLTWNGFTNFPPEFSGLTAAGHEIALASILEANYKSQRETWLPILDYLKEYYTELFESTPLENIIGTTEPPTTTTTTPAPCCPCQPEIKDGVLDDNIRVLEDGFNNFLQKSVEGFPAWLDASGFDPFPTTTTPVNLTRVVTDWGIPLLLITGELRNHTLRGHSRMNKIGPITSNLLRGNFSVYLDVKYENATGEYSVVGRSLIIGIPGFTGEGHFVGVDEGNAGRSSYDINIHFSDFGVTPDGYIDLSVATMTPQLSSTTNVSPKFYGLVGQDTSLGHAALQTQYANEWRTWLPIGDYLKMYMEEVFATTPISEMIGTTLFPPATTTQRPPCCPCVN